MVELVNTLFQLSVGGFLAALLLMLLTNNDRPEQVVDSKTLNIDGVLIRVETYQDGTSKVMSAMEDNFWGDPATVANGRLAPHWQEIADAGLLN